MAEPTKAEHAQCLKTFAKGHCRAVQLEGSEVRAAIKRFQRRESFKESKQLQYINNQTGLQNPRKNTASLQIDDQAKCLSIIGQSMKKS